MVPWLGLGAPGAGGPGSIPGQGSGSHMLQLGVDMPQLKILHAANKKKTLRAATKTWNNQINKKRSVILE